MCTEINQRERQILAAVDAGRGVLLRGCEPDLLVDGRWCDHTAVRTLVRGGLIRGATGVQVGERVAALVTDAGRELLVGTGSPGARTGVSS